MTESIRMSSIPDPTPNFDHRSQMRRVDKQYQLLKKRLIIAGSKVRERLLKEMREIRSSIQFLPAKIMLPPEYVAGPPIREYEYIPLQLPEYVPIDKTKPPSIEAPSEKKSSIYIPIEKKISEEYIPTKKESTLYIPVRQVL